MIQNKTFTNCNNFDPVSGPKKACPQQNHEYMKFALRIHVGSHSEHIGQMSEEASKANELCKVCDKFVSFRK